MIQLFRDWLEITKERANAIVFGVVVLSLLFPHSIEAKDNNSDIDTNRLDHEATIEEVMVKSHKSIVKSNTGAADNKVVKEEPKVKIARTINVTASAYTSTPDQCWGNPFITASGKRVYDGLIAANGLKFGTKVRFPDMYGDKVFTVDDRMSSRYGASKVDIWMDGPRSKALNFGRRYLKMEILAS